MNNNNIKSIFCPLEKKDITIVILHSVISLLLAIMGQAELLVGVTFLLSFFYSFKRASLALALIIVSNPIIGELASGFLQVVLYLPLLATLFFRALSKSSYFFKAFALFVVSICVVCFSFFFGYKTDLITFALQIITMTLFFSMIVVFGPQDVPIIVFSFICSGLIVLCFIFMGEIENSMAVGRLLFGDSIKTLSFICAIPLSFYLYSYMGNLSLFGNNNLKWSGLLKLCVMIVLFSALLMTLARGVLLSLIGGSLLMLFFTKRSTGKLFYYLFIAAIVMLVFQFVTDMDLFRMEHLTSFDEYSTGNGRTEIWADYINKMSQMGGQYVLFGTGPGNIERISNSGFYAHSTILDYYFSYGLFGFLIFTIVEILIMVKTFNKENIIPFIVVVTFLFAYSSHGGAANMQFFILQATMFANTKIKCYENIRYPKLV